MSVQIQMRRGTAAQWLAANPTLAEGEIGLELDTQKFKMGTGTTAWNSLGYYTAGASTVDSVNGQTGVVVLGTDNITEGTTNKYYTDARARASLSGSTGISYNSSTGAISSTITQYTDALARAAVSATGSLSYNSTTGVFSYTQPTNVSTFTNDSGYLTSSAIGSTVQGYDGDLQAIGALTGTTGLLKKTAANTWSLDTSTYLTSYTETDPIYTASSWYSTTNNSSNWNTAYGWGNHASAGYAVASNNLSDLTNTTTARTNLGLGTMAVANTSSYSTTGTDTTYAYRSNNLSDLANIVTARTNLGLGTMATANTSSYTVTGSDTTYAYRANNLSDLASASTARTNLGLGTAATMAGPSGTIVGTTDTQTLTNKRINSRAVAAGATSGTLTPNGDTTDVFNAFGLTGSITLAAPSGTPVDGQRLMIRLEDNGTGRGITWTTTSGAYRAIGVTLPSTTTASKVTYIGCVYNSTDIFWDIIAVATQA